MKRTQSFPGSTPASNSFFPHPFPGTGVVIDRISERLLCSRGFSYLGVLFRGNAAREAFAHVSLRATMLTGRIRVGRSTRGRQVTWPQCEVGAGPGVARCLGDRRRLRLPTMGDQTGRFHTSITLYTKVVS